MEVTKKIVFIKDWILNYVNSMPKKADSLVIGISGGIDSSVSSTLCAMTGIKTIVLTMPIKQKKLLLIQMVESIPVKQPWEKNSILIVPH